METLLKSKKLSLENLSNNEMINLNGGQVSPNQIVQAAIVIGAGIYGMGYALGKALYHATH